MGEYIDASMATPPPDPLLPIADLYREGYAGADARPPIPCAWRECSAARRPPTCRHPPPSRRSAEPVLILAWTGGSGHR